ncbi:Cysteine synthase 2 [Erysiphe neolycopersici]|uniref:Cysteine synthase 2 n=1 Tax=Erysiphe neolycopersici TaxID=212602 RepID=A0A420HVG8_9PEZI|nr:Cysteine synthase 2 [Erysiphe neolycopersici]
MNSMTQSKVNSIGYASIAFLSGIFFTLGLQEIRKLHIFRDLLQTKKSPTNLFSLLNYCINKVKGNTNSLKQLVANESSMPKIPEGIEEVIGNTPLFKIKSLSQATGCLILAKAEFLNGAGGSPKDRVALNMIRTAEAQGILSPGRGDTIYEGTVGSTGISLASLARALGYKTHICMPSDQSQEKEDILRCLGAQVERVTPAPITSDKHFVNLAKKRAFDHTQGSSGSRGFFADQFENLANFNAHFSSTGPEIWDQTGGQIDLFVSGAGTGGTISGVALYLKQKKIGHSKPLKVVLADPEGSGLYNKVKHGVMFSSSEKEGTRRRNQVDTIVEGVGINRLTKNFEAGMELIDDSVKVSDIQAMKMARWLVEKDGIFVGSSSALNCVAAVVAALEMPKGSQVVTIICDNGTRHLSKFWKKIVELKPDTGLGGEDLFNILGIKNNNDKRENFDTTVIKANGFWHEQNTE